ncbi:hypothetical protein GCM10010510_17400 [Streptomyces anandii JCM 4720]|nr:hypothetical protein GCM10010510_17400 [Streptomyces anandii JCM 4720]
MLAEAVVVAAAAGGRYTLDHAGRDELVHDAGDGPAADLHYFIGGEPLRHGFQWRDTLVLVAASGLLFGLGVQRFNQRDINS